MNGWLKTLLARLCEIVELLSGWIEGTNVRLAPAHHLVLQLFRFPSCPICAIYFDQILILHSGNIDGHRYTHVDLGRSTAAFNGDV
jgi:hypothetical protein